MEKAQSSIVLSLLFKAVIPDFLKTYDQYLLEHFNQQALKEGERDGFVSFV
ncbi:hypothetical protein QRD90_09645 [Peribacillus frigoritolerans]|nr:hypothetical protein [Peribacillus frigoritolerans]WJE49408.1 hypothetical protein QRD90_09645 [Peribacillus frigoritolerans]